MADSLVREFWELGLFTPDERAAVEWVAARLNVTFRHASWLWSTPRKPSYYTTKLAARRTQEKGE